ncbi:hypothetical protein J2X68_007693 [Streptomyces sp. 3330]|uniref:AraC-like ligand-binding domain-containing protein n=1 Tax=Streptomyces sp. 3330 TaxID=2817755 RepID=UPI0028615340|nr:hypothetical protein [Streptomyces sp. 3330]
MSSRFADDFWARQRLVELGPVLAWPTAYLPTAYLPTGYLQTGFRRTEKLVRQSDPEMYHLSLVLGGGVGFEHVGRAETYGPSDLWVSDTSRPYKVHVPVGLGRQVLTGVGVDFPKALLPLPADRVQRLLGRRLSGREGMGALLTGFLTGLEQQAVVPSARRAQKPAGMPSTVTPSLRTPPSAARVPPAFLTAFSWRSCDVPRTSAGQPALQRRGPGRTARRPLTSAVRRLLT